MSNTFSPRTDGTVGKVAVRSQAHAAHLTIPLMLNAGIDIQDNNPTGPEHTEGGDSPAQAPARHTATLGKRHNLPMLRSAPHRGAAQNRQRPLLF